MAQSVSSIVGRFAKAFAVSDATELGDADLLERFRSRADAVAFEAIVRRHGPMVLGVCRRLLRNSADADDAFQATFAILMRRASSLSRPERLAGWLFQVAYRTARRARAIELRRASNQLALPDIPVESPVAEIVWRELRPIFDEEVSRLPDKLRLPVVMCFLEGQTKRAAARSLGWPEGTFSCRLQQARELLQSRLARRGVSLSAGTLAVALFEGTASAAVSPALVSSTLQSVTSIAAGSALTAPVAALTQGVLQSMIITKVKIAAALVLTVGMLGGGASWVLQTGAGHQASAWAAEPGEKPSPTKAPSPEDLLRIARDRALVQQQLIDFELAQRKKSVTSPMEIDGALKKLLDRREQLLAQQRDLDDQIAKWKLDAVRQANQKKPTDKERDTGIDAQADAQKREIEALKKIIAELEGQNADLRELKKEQRHRAEEQRDQAIHQEMLARQNAELAEAQAELKAKEAQVARITALVEEKAATRKQLDEARADLERTRAVVEKLKSLLNERGRAVADRDAKIAAPNVRVAEAEVRQSEALVQAAEAKFQLRQKDRDRIAQLVAAKSVEIGLLDKAEAELAIARAEVAQATAALERSKALLEIARKQAELKVPANLPSSDIKGPAGIEAKLEHVLKLKAAGVASEADVDQARIAVAEARIRSELQALVALREREVARARKLLEAGVLGKADLQKAVDELHALQRWQSQWK